MGGRKANMRPCPCCGCTRHLTSHHIARRDNDKSFTLDACDSDHFRYLTPWHTVAGIEPGIDLSGARLGGIAQYFALTAQHNGPPELAEVWRMTDHGIAEDHGRKFIWARPRRVAADDAYTESLRSISKAAKITAALWKRILTDNRLPDHTAMTLMTSIEYYLEVASHPAEWVAYSGKNYSDFKTSRKFAEQSVNGELQDTPKAFGQEFFRERALAEWEALTMKESVGFLRLTRRIAVKVAS